LNTISTTTTDVVSGSRSQNKGQKNKRRKGYASGAKKNKDLYEQFKKYHDSHCHLIVDRRHRQLWLHSRLIAAHAVLVLFGVIANYGFISVLSRHMPSYRCGIIDNVSLRHIAVLSLRHIPTYHCSIVAILMLRHREPSYSDCGVITDLL
jgi:hypothetical protein